MKTLSDELKAAQKAASGQPYVGVTFRDRWGNQDRPRFRQYYQDLTTPGNHAAVFAADGSLVRARMLLGELFLQRVTDPDENSTYTSWTSQGTVMPSGTRGVALAADDDTVFLFYVHTDGESVRVRTSTDNGASFGAASEVHDFGDPVVYLAAACDGQGNCRLIASVDGDTVYSTLWDGNSWSEPAAWTNSVHSIAGLAMTYHLDYQVIICGAEVTTENPRVYSATLGDGFDVSAGSWSALGEVNGAEKDSGVVMLHPSIAPTSTGLLVTYLERYDVGTGSLLSNVHWTTFPFALLPLNNSLWREPSAFGSDTGVKYSGSLGLAAARNGAAGNIWLSAADTIFEGFQLAAYDATADVLALTLLQEEEDGRLRLELRNDPSATSAGVGRYSPGQDLAEQIGRGQQVELALGYTVAGTDEKPTPLSYFWVEAVEYVAPSTGSGRAGSPRVVVHARDGWWLLERTRARRQFVWDADDQTITQLALFILARAGLESATESGSSALGLKPAFTIQVGESFKTALRRLLEKTPDALYFSGDTGKVTELADDEAVQYSYGPADHPVVEGRYRELGPAFNRARVTGDGVHVEVIDYLEAGLLGDEVRQVYELNADSSALASNLGDYQLRKAEVRRRRDELEVFGVNCGQEVYDVVEVDDAGLGLSGAVRRVLGFTVRFERRARGRYDMTLRLGER